MRYLIPLGMALLLPTTIPSSRPRALASENLLQPNDNRTPAGILAGKVLTLSLEAREGTWYPEGPNGYGVQAAGFAEPGKDLTNPGPLIRVPVGTEVRVTIRNTLERKLMVYGLGRRRGFADSLAVPAGETREARFLATTPGTFWYAAFGPNDSTHDGVPTGGRPSRDDQLNGAIVIDPPGAPLDDRIFMISWWYLLDSTSPTGLGRATMAINGLSWPHTEPVRMTQGDSARWRVLNLSEAPHPMHLHGFYFQMRSKGTGQHDTLYTAAQRRMGVTESLQPYQTMSFAWSPTRPGNWIWHCHFVGHLSTHASLDQAKGHMDPSGLEHHQSGMPHQMFGLVMGINVAPKGPQPEPAGDPRRIRIAIRQKPNGYGKFSAYAFVLGGTPAETDPTAVPAPPGPTLVLTRGQPVSVNIVNQTADHAAIHWHGIELDSYPDGVPGVSGSGDRILPAIASGDSLTVTFTPPRAGTFMYHSHFNEEFQINGGLYGAIIVLEPGQTYDPATDKVMFVTSAGPWEDQIYKPVSPTMLNGEVHPAPMELKAGTRYRFRLINLTGDVDSELRLTRAGKPVLWRLVAKDGMTVPRVQATFRPAYLYFLPGEIYDFEYRPVGREDLVLNFGLPGKSPTPQRVDVAVKVR